MEFYASYTDPYTNTKENKYHDVEYIETYKITKKHLEYQKELNNFVDSFMKKNNLSYSLYMDKNNNSVNTTLYDSYDYRLVVNTNALNVSNVYDNISSYINEFYLQYKKEFENAILNFNFDIYVTDDYTLFNEIANYNSSEISYSLIKNLEYKYEYVVDNNNGFDKNVCLNNKSTDDTYDGRKKIILHYIQFFNSTDDGYSILKVYK